MPAACQSSPLSAGEQRPAAASQPAEPGGDMAGGGGRRGVSLPQVGVPLKPDARLPRSHPPHPALVPRAHIPGGHPAAHRPSGLGGWVRRPRRGGGGGGQGPWGSWGRHGTPDGYMTPGVIGPCGSWGDAGPLGDVGGAWDPRGVGTHPRVCRGSAAPQGYRSLGFVNGGTGPWGSQGDTGLLGVQDPRAWEGWGVSRGAGGDTGAAQRGRDQR